MSTEIKLESADIQALKNQLSSRLDSIETSLSDRVSELNLPIFGQQLESLGSSELVQQIKNKFISILSSTEVNIDPQTLSTKLTVGLKDIGIESANITATVQSDETINFLLEIRGEKKEIAQQSLDTKMGLPQLNFEIDGKAKVNFSYDLNLGFSFNPNTSDFKTDFNSSENELTVKLDTDFQGFKAVGELGLLRVDVENNGTTFNSSLNIDLTENGGQISVEPIVVTGNTNINLNLETSFGEGAMAPSIESDFKLNGSVSYESGAIKFDPSAFSFENVKLDVGSYISNFVNPVLQQVRQVTQPLQPLVDALYSDIKFFKDINFNLDLDGDGNTTLMDLAKQLDPSLRTDYFGAIRRIVTLVNQAPSNLSEINIPVPNFDLLGAINDFQSPSFKLSNLSLENINIGGNPIPGNIPQVDVRALLNELNTDAGRSTSQFISNFGATSGAGLEFPILSNPLQVFNLFIGKPMNLFTYDMPSLNTNLEFNRFFPLPSFPALGIDLKGSVSAGIDLDFGYDTFGLQRFLNENDLGAILGAQDLITLFDGFYLSDRENPNGTGDDRPEAFLNANLEAFAALEGFVARGGAGGGVYATMKADLPDLNNDGKVRLISEMNPSCLFDLGGDLSAGLSAYAEVGWPDKELFGKRLGERWEWNSERLILGSFNTNCTPIERQPYLASNLGNGVLQLNMGTHANERINFNTQDIHEAFSVATIADINTSALSSSQFSTLSTFSSESISALSAVQIVQVSAFGFVQEYSGIQTVVANGGEKYDLIDLQKLSLPSQISGGAGSDELRGGRANDTLSGDEGWDRLYGGDGNDSLAGGSDDDMLYAGGGDDTLDGGENDDILFGEQGNDSLAGGNGSDNLNGDDGNDYIQGGDGEDLLDGGNDSDILEGGNQDDLLYGGGGNDTLSGGTDNDFLDGGTDNDLLKGDIGDDQLIGAVGEDELIGGDGNDTLSGGDDNDRLQGDAGDDNLAGGNGDDNLAGSDGNDQLTGDTGNDTITGDSGSDLLDGGDGDDYLTGGEGDDQLTGDAGKDILSGDAGTDLLDGGDGNDAIAGGDGDDVALGGAGNDAIAGGADNDYIEGGTGNDTISGDAGDDVLNGNEGNDILMGGEGDDELYGNEGDDTLEGGAGSDLIDGGTGNNTVTYENDTAGVIINLDNKTYLNHPSADCCDTDCCDPATDLEPDFEIGAKEARDGSGRLDTLLNIQKVIASNHADVLVGNASANQFQGNGGDDIFIGNAGDDLLDGGAGNDTASYRRDPGSIQANLETRKVRDGFGHTDSLNSIENLIGSQDKDQIVGNDQDNILLAEAGNDSVDGQDGDDHIEGGLGDDSLKGGRGNDSLSGQQGQDRLEGGEGDDQLESGCDDDSLFGQNGNDILTGGDDKDYLDGGAGDDQLEGGCGDDELQGRDDNDTLSGGEGNDYLDGGTEDDQLFGGAGDDRLYGQDGNDILNGGIGNDSLRGGTGRDSLQGNEGDDILKGESEDDVLEGGIGNDTLEGGSENDILNGGDGDDVLDGGDGEDTLEAGEGNDRLSGGAGHDILISGAGNDEIYAGSGNDKISGGAGQDKLYAESGDDALNGDAGNDYLNGGAGNDSISGGAGTDELYGDIGTDTLDGGSGNDTINGGDGNDRLDGGVGDDILVGAKGNDALNGDAGDDSLTGDIGNDTINGGIGNDTVLYQTSPKGVVVNLNSISYSSETFPGWMPFTIDANTALDGFGTTDKLANLENTVGSDFADTLIGSDTTNVIQGLAGDDQLIGNAGNDVINGGIGSDVINGGTGNDTLTGGGGHDRFILVHGDGIDTITEFGGIGTQEQPRPTVLAEIDTIKFEGAGFTAKNMLLTQTGSDLVISFEGINNTQVVLQNFQMQDLDNFRPGSAPNSSALGNILFDGDTTIQDSFDVFDANWRRSQILPDLGINRVTFLNDLNNNIQGFENSDDVINGQGGNDILNGLSGDDLLRGGTGNDTLRGGAGNDILVGGAGNDVLTGGSGNDRFTLTTNGGTDIITDFTHGQDVMGLTTEITFAQLTIAQGTGANSTDTLISFNSGTNTDLLAILTGIQATAITAANFAIV